MLYRYHAPTPGTVFFVGPMRLELAIRDGAEIELSSEVAARVRGQHGDGALVEVKAPAKRKPKAKPAAE